MITARSAILQALRRGPGYGQLLRRRVAAAMRRSSALPSGSLYPALRALKRSRLIRGWDVVPGRERGGRSREYFELTPEGIREAEREAAALVRLALAARPVAAPSAAERAAMRSRLERLDDLFDFARGVRGSHGRRRRPA
jgi:DNA-binding PadR family transcriptional regulator